MSAEVRRVAVVGDCPLFRRGLAQVIESTADLALVAGAAGSVEEVEGRLQPGDVVLVDLQLRPADLSAAVFRLAYRGAEVLVLCSPLQQDIGPPMEAGARGCLSRQAA